jgi:putative ABC transport system ATP-binding protein
MGLETFIQLREVSKVYSNGGGEIVALDRVDLRVRRGEFMAIVGKSGSGKSTLLNIIGCLDTPSDGEYYFDGETVAKLADNRLSEIRNQNIGFIFQGFNLISSLSAIENVELPLTYRGLKKDARRGLAIEALMRVGLGDRLHHRPGEMSGGQQQRVAIARAIAARPPLILADEPTGNLDSKSGKEVISILSDLHREGRTVILITHDSLTASSAGRLVKISDGRITGDRAIRERTRREKPPDTACKT